MPRPRYELHDAIENRHWWFLARRRIIMDVLSRHLPAGSGKTVVEVGCGTGGNLIELSRHYTAIGTEISPDAAAIARQKTGCAVFLGDSLSCLGERKGEIDAVLLLDLLEHLHDPVAFLRSIHGSIHAGTYLFVTVPAGQWFFSEHDLAFGHLRRYSRRGLLRMIAGSGFRVEFASHFNTVLFLPAVGIRLVRKAVLPLRCSKPYKTDFWVPPPPLNVVLTAMMSMEARVMRMCPLPFGLSLIAVARKRGGGRPPP